MPRGAGTTINLKKNLSFPTFNFAAEMINRFDGVSTIGSVEMMVARELIFPK